jgi:DNA-binding XRE family transcriptional regulator
MGVNMAQKDNKIICSLRQYRIEKKLSQDELAKIIGIKRQAIYDIESGRYLPIQPLPFNSHACLPVVLKTFLILMSLLNPSLYM